MRLDGLVLLCLCTGVYPIVFFAIPAYLIGRRKLRFQSPVKFGNAKIIERDNENVGYARTNGQKAKEN